MKKLKTYFTPTELIILTVSVCLIILSHLLSHEAKLLNTAASLIGVSSILLCAKANPIGQALMIVFSIIYGIASFGEGYFGEMITYLGMTLPMSLLSLISWLRHPYGAGRMEVKVAGLSLRAVLLCAGLCIPLTVGFYFILGALGTSNLPISTLSVLTSFIAAYLTFLRSEYYSLAYAANDLVLIILWGAAALGDLSHLSMVICFGAFLINDIYCFVSWRRIKARQSL